MISLKLKPLLKQCSVLALTLLLGACEQDSAPVDQDAQTETISSPPAPEVSEVAEEPPAPLDLSVPSDVLDEHVQGDDYSLEQEQKLPELFDLPEDQRKTKVSTKLLLNDDALTPAESIDGAELSVERRFR